MDKTLDDIMVSDLGTPELRQHHIIVEELTDTKIKRARSLTQVPMDRYRTHKYISAQQWAAGEKLLNCFIYAGIYQSTTSSCYEVMGISNTPENFSDRQLDARQRFYEALDQLKEKEVRIVFRICCLGEWAYDQGLTIKTAMNRLRRALDKLAKYYGISNGGEKNDDF